MKKERARRNFLAYFTGVGLGSTLLPGIAWARLQDSAETELSLPMMRTSARLAGLDFTDEELGLMVDEVNKNFAFYEEMREVDIDNSVAPALYFDPWVPGIEVDRVPRPLAMTRERVSRPQELEDVAFWPVTRLAALIESKQVSSVELTEMYLGRLERWNPTLNCVVNLTPERARESARRADAELAAGRNRGPLHGIPWGAKDIIAVAGYPTTWGAGVFETRVIDRDAAVVERLDEAGAVLVAKLTTGELAFGHNWFGGRTRNPWNPEEGSSGSSAGSGSATGAGLVGFAIGSDTGGSILSPSVRCGVSGLRPTFGRVSRHGVMAAGFSLDKIGPMCRSVEDCALVLSAITGSDDRDVATREDVPFNWDGRSGEGPRIGYFELAFDEDASNESPASRDNARRTLDALREQGHSLTAVELPRSRLTYFIEYVERSAGFDGFKRDRLDADLVRQNHRGELRASHLVPAVEYLQANRIRRQLMDETAALFNGLDAIVAPWRSINPLTSMTGHPVVTVRNGFTPEGTPTGIAFVGQVYGEGTLLAAAKAYQDATGFHDRHPDL